MNFERFDSGRALVHTPTADISYIDVGPHAGTGAPALFIHGVGTNAYLWRNVIAELADERRCIALDLPIHGQSSARPDQDLSLAGLAAVVADFCEALDLTDIDLVANDTGGAVAQIFAARNARLLRSFVLTNCEAHDNVPPEAFKPTVDLAKAGLLVAAAPDLLADLSAAREAVFAMGYEGPEQPDLDMVRAFLEPVLGTPERAKQFERLLSLLDPADLLAAEPALAKLDVPTLIVWGTGDTFFDVSWAYWLRDTIPGATEVVELDGARVFFPDERAAELTPLLRRHWAATAARRRVEVERGGPMAPDTNLTDLAHRFADSLNRRDFGAMSTLARDDYVNHNPYVPAEPGAGGALSFFEQWLEALPDSKVVCEDAIAVGTLEEGTVVGRYTYMGTFKKPLMGFAPTGKRIVMRSIDIWRVQHGKVAEHWDELNTADFFAQLEGAEPQPRTGAAAP